MVHSAATALSLKRLNIVLVLCLQSILFVLFVIFARYSEKQDVELYPIMYHNPAKRYVRVKRCRNAIVTMFAQLAILNIFVAFTEYDPYADASDHHNSLSSVFGGFPEEANPIHKFKQLFQDVHVMIFVGFGFLMTFLKRYGFSSVGFNFLLAALIVQWALLCQGFYDLDSDNKIRISIVSLLDADVAAATVLISMGAVLGRTSYIQLLVMGIFEIGFFTVNRYIAEQFFVVTDAGDSIFVHAFGAYFGLAVSFVLGRFRTITADEATPGNQLEGSSYTSDLFAMIGTLFLWMFWPSFNSAEQTGDDQHRAVINTYLSLAACCVTTFAMSSAFTENHKFDMVHVQNSTLAGGVAVGTAANLMLQPYGAIAVGIVAGMLSVFGYSVMTPWIDRKMRIKDTCGVHNLHGMPAILAALVGALMAWLATEDQYQMSLYKTFPARANRTAAPTPEYPYLAPGLERTALGQAGFQLVAILTTLVLATASGLVTGYAMCHRLADPLSSRSFYDDDPDWIVAGDVETSRVITIGKTADKPWDVERTQNTASLYPHQLRRSFTPMKTTLMTPIG